MAQFSKGIHIPNLRAGIIWHTFGNERKAAQRIGRRPRLNPDQTAPVRLLLHQDTIGKYWVAQALATLALVKVNHSNATPVTS